MKGLHGRITVRTRLVAFKLSVAVMNTYCMATPLDFATLPKTHSHGQYVSSHVTVTPSDPYAHRANTAKQKILLNNNNVFNNKSK